MSEHTIRTFPIDGVERVDFTQRTALVEHFAPVQGATVLDLGAGDGYESRVLAMRGAARTVAVEAKDFAYEAALFARNELGVDNHDVLQLDVRQVDELGLGTFDVVLCFGLLYHLENPFNFLRRVRRVTDGVLVLETHVAPDRMDGLLDKHAYELSRDNRMVELDGVPFVGKLVEQAADHTRSKGSLDAPTTFWLTPESLLKAVVRAGFRIDAYFHELDDLCPPVVLRWGSELGFGHANTKVFLVATPAPPEPDRSERIAASRRDLGAAPPTPGRALARRAAAVRRARRVARRIVRR